MSAPIRDIRDLDVPLADVEAHMADQRRIATLLTARASKPLDSVSDRIAYADAARLIETRAAVATDDSYPGWAEHIAALQAANPRQTARKEGL